MNQFFPYAGSSNKYARLIAEMIRREGFETYAEPMVGSGAVFFSLAPQSAFICDLEWLHTNLYRCTKDDVEPLIHELDGIPPVKEWFLEVQKNIYEIGDRWVVAAAWYALLILCYNGVVLKKDGLPYLTWGDRYLSWTRRLPTYKQRLRVVNNMLRGVEIYSGDYKICPQADIAFFDPPWIGSKEDYGTDFEHTGLAEYLRTYHGKWILTVNDCDAARVFYTPIAEWSIELEPFYSVSPVKKGRFKRKELLMTNFTPKMFGG